MLKVAAIYLRLHISHELYMFIKYEIEELFIELFIY